MGSAHLSPGIWVSPRQRGGHLFDAAASASSSARPRRRPLRGGRASARPVGGIEMLEPRRLLASAVEVATPQIEVRGNNVVIANNDTTPSNTDHTNFGTVAEGSSGPTRTYTVTNIGGGTLQLLNPALPLGYVVTEGLDNTLSAGESDTFTVRLGTDEAGIFDGEIVIASNDPDDAVFSFAVAGTVEAEDVAPQIQVKGNNVVIANNDTTPSNTDHTNFGSITEGSTGPTRTYTVTNIGGGTLELLNPALPLGYVVTEGLDDELEAGESDTFTVRLNTDEVGTFEGEIVIASNDPDDAIFSFAITGTVTPKTPVGTPPVKINFQPAGRPIPSGYLADVGQVFGDRGNGFTYGFNQAINTATRDRNLNPDQRIDTLVHTQLYGNRTWEIAVPNGTYSVKLAAGDPQYFDSVYRINVEGQLAINATPTSGNRFFEATRVVTVSDGRLTVSNASGAVNNKLNYIEITPASAVTRINFQPAGRPVPSGYLADTGAVFGSRGNGQSYGWNLSASSFTRDRGLNSDQRFDTLVHTQLYGNRTWELAVANGTYEVTVVAGDPQYTDSVYRLNVEGQLTVNGTPTSANRFITGTRTVTVNDGRLTISNASGAVNNKIAFVDVVKV